MQRAALVALVLIASFLSLSSASADVSPYAHLKFRGVGPAVSGGRVPAVAGTDADPFLYYAGGSGGGVWKTENGGTTWAAVFEHKPVSAIGYVAIAPSNKDVVWVGTGEANPRNDDISGDGVWKSTDGGKTFKHMGLDGSMYVSSILIDAKNPNVVLVGALGDVSADSADRGVYRTTDGGKTWTKTLFVGPRSGVADLARNPKIPGVVFAGVWQVRRTPWNLDSGGPDDGLYRSDDGGVTWRKLEGHGLPAPPMGRVGVAIAPSNPKRVFAVIQSKEGVLWRSDDGGATWRRISSDTIVNQRPFYYSHVWVDPQNDNHLIAQSVDMAQSKDGGKTWKAVDSAVHGDHHSLWWAADGKRIIDGSDGGVAITHDSGDTWEWRNNIDIGQVYHLGYDLQNPYTICAALQDNEAWCAPSNSLDPMGILPRDWYIVQGGDGVWVWPDPLDPNFVWSDLENGVLGIFNKRTGETVDVTPYPHDTNGVPLAPLPYRFNWNSPIAFLPQNPRTVYFGGNAVFETTDDGRHWTTISPDLTLNDKLHQQVSGGSITLDVSGAEFYDTILDIAPSPVRQGVIWVGTDDGLIQLTRDGGARWSNVTPPGVPPYGEVETVEPSHFDPETAFAIFDRHLSGDLAPYVYETNDYGLTWRSIAANLPRQPVRTIRQDPRNPDVLYAGLEDSFWISFDAGTSWQSLQLNLPTSSVHDLRIQPQADDLLVATHGRSLWILDDLTPLEQLERAKAAKTYFFQPRAAYRFWTYEPEQSTNDSSAQANYFAGENPPYGAILSFYQAKPSAARPSIDIVDASGRVVRHIAGTHESNGAQVPNVTNYAGVNRVVWDLQEDPPTKWNSAPKWNRGSDDGPYVVPGTFQARLHAGGQTLARTIIVKPDPRTSWTMADMIARHDFEVTFNDELDGIDKALNHLDAVRKQLDELAKSSAATAALLAQINAARDRANAVAVELSTNPRNGEDDFTYTSPDRLRERVQGILAIATGGSWQPPWDAHLKEAAAIRSEYQSVMADYAKFVNEDLAKLNAALEEAKLRPIP